MQWPSTRTFKLLQTILFLRMPRKLSFLPPNHSCSARWAHQHTCDTVELNGTDSLLNISQVFLLQTADLYDIRQIIRLGKDSKEWNDKLVNCRTYVGRGTEDCFYLLLTLMYSVVDLPDIVRQYIFQTVSLAKIVEVRINYIVDPILKKKLEKPNEVINQHNIQPSKQC